MKEGSIEMQISYIDLKNNLCKAEDIEIEKDSTLKFIPDDDVRVVEIIIVN